MNKVIIIVLVGLSLLGLKSHISSLNGRISALQATVKAYDQHLSGIQDQSRVYQLTIDQITSFSDSILQQLNATREELGIKDKQLLALSYQETEVSRTDTILYPDTIFVNSFQLDTIIGDKWYQNRVELSYPNSIILSPSFTLETQAIAFYKKETVNSPKRLFIARWFQRKHKVIHVSVKESNPYADKQEQKFIQVVR